MEGAFALCKVGLISGLLGGEERPGLLGSARVLLATSEFFPLLTSELLGLQSLPRNHAESQNLAETLGQLQRASFKTLALHVETGKYFESFDTCPLIFLFSLSCFWAS